MLERLSRCIMEHDPELWNSEDAEEYIKTFDTKKIIQDIKKKTDNSELLTIRHFHTPKSKTEYLKISMPLESAREIMPKLILLAAEYGPAILDITNNCKIIYKNIFDDSPIKFKKRKNELINAIQHEQELKPLFMSRKIIISEGDWNNTAYVLIFKKNEKVSFLNRTQAFHSFLKKIINDEEKLECRNHCFTVISLKNKYEISFSLEGYKKNADITGYVDEKGLAKTENPKRISIYKAFRELKKFNCDERIDIMSRLSLPEMIYKYPNPADRFAASLNIAKKIRRMPFDISLSGQRFGGSYLTLYKAKASIIDEAPEETSMLCIEESSFSYLLPIIKKECPQIIDTYYTETFISSFTWKKIIARIENTKKMLLSNNRCDEMLEIAKDFSLIKFDKNETEEHFFNSYLRLEDNGMDYFYKHRHKICEFYDFVLQWLKTQLDDEYFDIIISIMGP